MRPQNFQFKPLTYIGYATDEEIRHKGSSGGIVTAIIKYLFDQGLVQTGLSFYFERNSCQFKPKLIYAYDDYNHCGSIYQDIDLITFIKSEINNIQGCAVITCAPCQVKPIRAILSRNSIKAFILSYVCSGQTTIEGIYKYYNLLNISPRNVIGMRYRGNGWPSGIEIKLQDGKSLLYPNYTEPWKTLQNSYFFRPRRCFFCKQVFSKDADIAAGDPWLDEYKRKDVIGNTIFTVHTPEGINLLNQMNIKQYIHVNEISFDQFYESQRSSFIRKRLVDAERDFLEKNYNLVTNKFYRKCFLSSYRMMKFHLRLISFGRKAFTIVNKTFAREKTYEHS